MNSEYFKILREINSLDEANIAFLSVIEKENKRITFIENNRHEAQEKIQEIQNEIKELNTKNLECEKSIDQLSKTLENIEAQLLTPQGGLIADKLNTQTQEISTQKEMFENQYFENLEKKEDLEKALIEKNTFLKGSLESLSEITEEVFQVNQKTQEKINSNQNRINILLDELPVNFRELYLKIKKLNLKISIFSKIIGGSCNICKMIVPRPLQDSIEKNLQLKTCNGCSRIILPFTSL